MRYWLMKSEPSVFTIEDLEKSPHQTVKWIPTKGIRNYQARNFMRDDMSLGDLAFFYQSNCDTPGIVGIMKISKLAYPDPCLLYTSPSPRDKRQSRMPSSA